MADHDHYDAVDAHTFTWFVSMAGIDRGDRSGAD
jgi:hypothetical protein